VAQITCGFCGVIVKANGNTKGPVLRSKVNAHRRENHKAEMAPGIKFQRYAQTRDWFTLVQGWMTERDELETFLADEATLDHSTIRKMVEDKLAKADTREQLVERLDKAAIQASEAYREWLQWVRDENTFELEELLRLVKIWNAYSFTVEDEKDLQGSINKLVMQYI
jgi:hypothetical protein